MDDKEKLVNFRKALNLTQIECANKLGVSKGLIASIESGTRSLTLKLNQKIINVFGVDLLNSNKPLLNNPQNIVAVTFYHISAAAGYGTWLGEEPEKEALYFDRRWLEKVLRVNPEHIHLITAQGDSMDSGWNQPDDIKDGDLLMVDTSITTGNNQIFVIIKNNDLCVKQLTKQGDNLIVISKNKKYQDEIFTPDKIDSEIKIIGKVVWNGSKENV